jgi:hypothetical protein
MSGPFCKKYVGKSGGVKGDQGDTAKTNLAYGQSIVFP